MINASADARRREYGGKVVVVGKIHVPSHVQAVSVHSGGEDETGRV